MNSPADNAHDRAVEAGLEFYTDPASGLMVMTALHHLRRGQCCSNGCRHCPYDDEAQ